MTAYPLSLPISTTRKQPETQPPENFLPGIFVAGGVTTIGQLLAFIQPFSKATQLLFPLWNYTNVPLTECPAANFLQHFQFLRRAAQPPLAVPPGICFDVAWGRRLGQNFRR